MIKPIVLALFLCAASSWAQSSFTVQGINGKSVELSAADLSKLPQQTIKTTDHDKPVTFQGVALKDVLAKVDLPLGESFHHTATSYYLLVEAKDGYRAIFSWAEMDPGFMDKPVYMIAKPDGSFQLVVPGEKRGGRWVRQVTALRVKQDK